MNILLLRGLVREKRHWGNFPDMLREKGHQVLCIDLPGVGENADLEFPWNLKEAVKKIRHQFLNQKSAGPYELVAISLGGMIALEWANLFPADFTKLYLINTSAANLGTPWERMRPKAMQQCLQISTEKDVREREKIILQMTTNTFHKNPQLLDEWYKIAIDSPYTSQTVVRQLTAAIRFKAPKKINVPVILLASENDNMVNVNCSKRLAKRLQAEIRIHPTAGHDIAVDDPAWLTNQI
ncbi:MAG: alpha/beta hydrolase [Bdellovibrionales bacterium]|nr:alpha/beta hydrolase [Bdellovibrionales bacterium]